MSLTPAALAQAAGSQSTLTEATAWYGPADYAAINSDLRDVEERLLAVRADPRGMRWVRLGDTVLFYGERRLDVPYEEFVARVDIGHAGRYYRDSVGVTTVVVERDEQGQVRRQAVRVVALPQPNYSAFLMKEELDVYKLETIDVQEDEQRVWMVTVHSPNGSARCDDGYLSFSRSADGAGTVVTFLACQDFPVPPVMALTGLDRWTWFKRAVTESAYRRFFESMMTNVQRCQQGEEFRIGRPAASTSR